MTRQITEVTLDSPSCAVPAIIHLESSEMYDDCSKQLRCVRYKSDGASQRGILVEDERQLRHSFAKPLKHYSNFLVLHNRLTGQMQLVQTEQYDLVDSVYTESNHLASYNERRAIRSFGNRQMRQRNRHTKQVTNNLTMVMSDINRIMREYKSESDNSQDQHMFTEIGSQVMDSILPPRNQHASTPSKLYRVKAIIDKALLQELTDIAKEVLETDPENPKLILDNFLLNKLRAAQQSTSDASESVMVAKVCLYLEALGKLMRMKPKAQSIRTGPLSSYSDKIDRNIRTFFWHHQNSNPYYTARHGQLKAVCYYMALLFALGKTDRLPLTAIRESMGVPYQMILQCAAAIGATYSKRTKMLELSLIPMRPKKGHWDNLSI